ncbi:MAG: hypothetical protein SFW62_05080 [Alphaproteobacteria bacterium]|nr:hypothetical protein [Alphaproteobacteria bacterium]
MHAPRTTPVQIFFAWLVLAALVLRGLVPVGYMPDFSGKSALPSIAICGGKAHSSNAPLKDSGTPSHHQDAPCLFAFNKSFSLESVKPPALAVLALVFSMALAFAALVLERQRLFGNASSRSPPTHS